MNEVNIDIPRLGRLRITEIYEYYDQPLLYSCENRSGQIFIALSVEDLDETYRWFYLPVSFSRYNSIRQGIISLQHAFLKSEEGWVWNVNEVVRDKSYEVNELRVEDISLDDLPCEDQRLSFIPRTLPELAVPALVEAVRSSRDVLDISISADNYHSTEIDAETLGLVLLRTQALIHALGQPGESLKRPITKAITENTTMRATLAFAASFGIRLESEGGYDLFGETKTSFALSRLMSLLAYNDDVTEVVKVLKGAGIKASSRYRSLLKTIRDTNITLVATWASPLDYSSEMKLRPHEAARLLSTLNVKGQIFSKVHSIEGQLKGIYTGNNSFWFQSDKGAPYQGLIDESLRNRIFKVPARAFVTIEESIELNEISQQEHIKYILKDINILSSSELE